jgi:hypothetical protein
VEEHSATSQKAAIFSSVAVRFQISHIIEYNIEWLQVVEVLEK